MPYLFKNNSKNPCKHEIEKKDELYRKRKVVFKDKLKWDVNVINGRETDEYDDESATYMMLDDDQGNLIGGVRFTPTTGPYMIKDKFPDCLHKHITIPNDPKTYEASRFFYDPLTKNRNQGLGMSGGTVQLFLGMLEFGVSKNLNGIVTFTDLRIERMLRNVAWKMHPIGDPVEIKGIKYVIGILPVSQEILEHVRKKTGINDPVLMPAPSSNKAA